MIAYLVPLLLLAQQETPPPSQDTARVSAEADSVTDEEAEPDSIRRRRRENDGMSLARRMKRTPLTAELLSNAYRDSRAKEIIARAREARGSQDSSLRSYEAITRQRISAGLAFRAVGRDRLAFRTENATRVRWHRDVGAHIDVLGTRTAIPMAFPGARAVRDMLDMSPIPYFPGRETLLQLSGMTSVDDDEGMFIHPLGSVAEAYYQYATGDSMSYRLPDGTTVRLVEVRIAAREPQFDLVVGSVWFDRASGQVVRAAYRPAAPFDIKRFVEQDDPHEFDDVPKAVRPMIFPMELKLEAFTVEYALHRGRWWLPRHQSVEGRMRVGFMRAPVQIYESFAYNSVNGFDSLPPIHATSRRGQVAVSVDEKGMKTGFNCAPTDTVVQSRRRYRGAVRVQMRIPCDTAALARSPLLPESIYDSGEELFGMKERAELEKELSFAVQPAWDPQRPQLHLPLDQLGLTRYNRVEGLSLGASFTSELGRGYSAELLGRIGHADLEPNGELRLVRTAGDRRFGIGVYRRLVAANDWGEPLSLGASISGFLFGRDEGFYYRSLGAELTGGWGTSVTWRLFGERQRRASVETQLSLAHAINGYRFLDNIVAARADQAGAALRGRFFRGDDPQGWRFDADVRLEGAAGDFEYGRGAADLTMMHGLGRRLTGAIGFGAGSTVGDVPPQRLWYVGGAYTVRGQRAGSRSGDAFWLGRAELGTSLAAFRPVVFYDLGWAGSREQWSHPGTPISGAGAGVSILDGLLRFDVAKGIKPNAGWRLNTYVEARF